MSFLERATMGLQMPTEATRARESACHLIVTVKESVKIRYSGVCGLIW